jgi:glycosyltransferase involved in cell wall biosynthesis
MKLSLCIATFNEEKNLHYPLDSAYDLVDEVVIVDGGSTDKTVEIAKSYGKKVRVISTSNPKMFHINKQKAIEAAKGEWILQLDADEELSEKLKQEIKKITQGRTSEVEEEGTDGKTSEVNEKVAYWLPRKNWFLTRFLMKGGQYPDYTIRLYKNGVAKFPCKDVHENVEVIDQRSKIKDQKAVVGFLKNPLLHYADPDFSRYLMRWDRYTTLEVEKMGKDARLGFFNYVIWKPKITFLSMYFRHKGFLDGFPGLVFALFSSFRFIVIYVKWWMKIRH